MYKSKIQIIKRHVTFAEPLVSVIYEIPGKVEIRSHSLSDKEREKIMNKLRCMANKSNNNKHF